MQGYTAGTQWLQVNADQTVELFALVTADAGIKTGAPSGGTAATWKLGVEVTTASVFDATKYIQLEIGGTLYKLATCS